MKRLIFIHLPGPGPGPGRCSFISPGRRWLRVLFRALARISSLCIVLVLTAQCAKDIKNFESDFLFTDTFPAQPYSLFTLLDDYPALKSAFKKLKADEFNLRMDAGMRVNSGSAAGMMRATQKITLEPNSSLRTSLLRLSNILNRLRTGNPDAYQKILPLFERIRSSPYDVIPALVPVKNEGLRLSYTTKSDADMERSMIDLAELLEDPDTADLVTDLEDFLIKALRTNATARSGIENILNGLVDPSLLGDASLKDEFIGLIAGVGNAMNQKTGFSDSKSPETTVKELIVNLEKYYTAGGSVYETVGAYKNAGHSSELSDVLTDLYANSRTLVNPGTAVKDPSKSILGELAVNVNMLSFTSEVTGVDASLKDLIAMDLKGRLRASDTSSDALSALDTLVFMMGVAEVYGYNWDDDSGNTFAAPHLDNTAPMTGGMLTLGDSMHALRAKLDTAELGIFSVLKNSEASGQVDINGTSVSLSRNHSALGLLQGESKGEVTSHNPATDSVYTKTLPWVMGWIKRVIYEGYGPYYNKNRTSGGQYVTPDGRVYDPSASGNYKASWYTSYFQVEVRDGDSSGQRDCVGIDGSRTAAPCPTTSTAGSRYQINEIIGQGDSSRAVDSDEEALYKNFMWLLHEKRFVLVIPMQAKITTGGYSALEDAAFFLVVANGLKGLMNAKPYCSNLAAQCEQANNGMWWYYDSSGNVTSTGARIKSNIGSDGRETATGNNTLYFSNQPGAVAMLLEVWGYGTASTSYGFTDTTIWGVLYNSLVFRQKAGDFAGAIPPVVAYNFPVFERVGFLTSAEVTSSQTATYWSKRNKLLPLVAALAKTLCDQSDAASGKNAFALLGPAIRVLARPYISSTVDPDNSDTPLTGGTNTIYLMRVRGTTGNRSMRSTGMTQVEYYPDCYNDEGGQCNYVAGENNLRSLVSLLSENKLRYQDGMLNLLGKTDTLSGLVRMLAKLGAADKANARTRFITGLEQLISQTKINADSPTAAQFNIETTIDEMVAKLAAYPDSRSSNLNDASWDDVTDVTNMIRDYISTGPYGVLGNLKDILDILVYASPSETEVSALLDVLGEILTNADGTASHELTALLTRDAPIMVRLSAPHARSLVGAMEGLSRPGGAMSYLYSSMRSDYSIDEILSDTQRLAASPLIQSREENKNSVLHATGWLMKYFADLAETGRRPDPDGYYFADHWNSNEPPYLLFDRLNFILSRKE